MPDSPRLAELRRQRALLREHAAWLDAEIAREEAASAGGFPSTNVAASFAPTSAVPAVSPAVVDVTIGNEKSGADAEAIMEEYRTPTTDLQRDVRTGCFLYFAAALLILGAVVVILYFALRHGSR